MLINQESLSDEALAFLFADQIDLATLKSTYQARILGTNEIVSLTPLALALMLGNHSCADKITRAKLVARQQASANRITDKHEIRTYLCMIRYLISCVTPNDNAIIKSLLDIPEIRDAARGEVLTNEKNELLKFAIAKNNQGAQLLLRQIPSVTVEENYVPLTAEATLAKYEESSMIATPDCVSRAVKHYGPNVATKDAVERVFLDFYMTLQDRYNKDKATFENEKKQIIELPLSYDDFATMHLSEIDRQKALEAYYTNTNHTAFRYLSVPNPWIDKNAKYSVPANDKGDRSANFSEHKRLMALLWLAAKDKDKANAPIDGHTLQTRIDHYVGEFALLGRANNHNLTSGDKPSCPWGVNSRLQSAVVGHPLIHMLNMDYVWKRFFAYAEKLFIKTIQDEYPSSSFRDAWNKYTENWDLVDALPLRMLNITIDQFEYFFELLKAQFPKEDISQYEPPIRKKLQQGPIHFINLASDIDQEAVFEKGAEITPYKMNGEMHRALTQIDLFAKQLREEYQQKRFWLRFFCPETKLYKATQLEKLAATIRADFSQGHCHYDWMQHIRKAQNDDRLVGGILSHRTKALLDNIAMKRSEWGIEDHPPRPRLA